MFHAEYHMNKTTCSCGRPRRRSGLWCLICHAKHMREWRKAHPPNQDQRFRQNARSYAKVYLRRGKLVRQPCSCGNPKSQMHHEDYGKPLEVIWLCRECHLALHREKVSKAESQGL